MAKKLHQKMKIRIFSRKKSAFESAKNSNLFLKVPKIGQQKNKNSKSVHKKMPKIVQVHLNVPKKGPQNEF